MDSIFVSLGGDCEAAFNIREYKTVDQAHFFDWLMTPINVVRELVETRFAYFLKKDMLLRIGDHAFRDKLYNIDILHDFDDLASNYDDVKAKYTFLANRFINLISNTSQKIIFVRKYHPDLDGLCDEHEAFELYRYFSTMCNCSFIYVHHDTEKATSIRENFITLAHSNNTKLDWRGDREQWFQTLDFVETRMEYRLDDQTKLIEIPHRPVNHYELLPNPPHDLPFFAAWDQHSGWHTNVRESPIFFLGDAKSETLSYFYNETGIPETGIFTLSDCLVTNAGLVIKDSRFVACNYIGHSVEWCRHRIERDNVSLEKINTKKIKVQKAILMFGGGYDIYGHWLVDIIPKFYLLHLLGIDYRNEKILTPIDLPPFGRSFLELLNIENDQLVFYDPLHDFVAVDQLYVPTLLRGGDRTSEIFSQSIHYFRSQIIDKLDSGTSEFHKKIYVSRKNSGRGSRSLTNSENIENIARELGFSIVYPEQLTIRQQIKLFSEAAVIIGEYGSALHNSIFSPEGAIVCALRGNQIHPAFLQSGISEALKQKTCYIFGKTNDDPINYSFNIDESVFRNAISLFDKIK